MLDTIKFGKKTYKIKGRDSGAECNFYKISEKEGIKVYYDKELAQRAIKRQRLAYKNKIGPKVLSRLQVVNRGYYDYYGYKTEIAKVITTKNFIGRKELAKKAIKVFRLKNVTMAWVLDEMVRIWNTGKLKGKPVIIDFGDCSFCEDYY